MAAKSLFIAYDFLRRVLVVHGFQDFSQVYPVNVKVF